MISHHKRSFLLQQTGTNTETNSQTTWWARDFGTLSHLKAQRTPKNRKQKEFKSKREWWTARAHGLPDTTGLKHIWTHRDCGRTHKALSCARWSPWGGVGGGRGHMPPSLIQKLAPTDSHLQMVSILEKSLFRPEGLIDSDLKMGGGGWGERAEEQWGGTVRSETL